MVVDDGVQDGDAVATQVEQRGGFLAEGHLDAGRLIVGVVAAGFVGYDGAHFVISVHHVELRHQIQGLLDAVKHVSVLGLADVQGVQGVLGGGGVFQLLRDGSGDLAGFLEGGVDLGLQGFHGVEGAVQEGGDGFGAEGWVIGAAAELCELGAGD